MRVSGGSGILISFDTENTKNSEREDPCGLAGFS